VNKKPKEPCDWHRPKRLPYLERAKWADVQRLKGRKQKQCPDCGRWFFPDEWGEKPND
jgi:hypothetical protein